MWQFALIQNAEGKRSELDASMARAIELATEGGDINRVAYLRPNDNEPIVTSLRDIPRSDISWPSSDEEEVSVCSAFVAPRINQMLSMRSYRQGNYVLSIQQMERAFTGYLETGQVAFAVIAAVNIAGTYAVLNEHATAIDAVERAIDLARPCGWKAMLGSAYRQRAELLCNMGHFAAAREAETESRRYHAAFTQSRNFVPLLEVSGRISHQLGDLPAALKAFTAASNLARSFDQPDTLIDSLLGAAKVQLDAGEIEAAESLATTALQTANDSDVHLFQSNALRVLSQVAQARGHREQAKAHGMAALAHAEAIAGYLIPPDIFVELARCHADDGEYEEAYTMSMRAIEARNKVQSKEATNRAIALQVHIAAERERVKAEHQRQLAKLETQRASELREANTKLAVLAQELKVKNLELDQLSKTDRLTGLANRLRLDAVLDEELARSQRQGEPLSLILLDIDRFKSVNDTFGHQVGDIVLIEIAKVLKTHTRPYDVVGRWGGEEFLVICSNTSLENAVIAAEKLRMAVESHPIEVAGARTSSFGVATLSEGEPIGEALGRADAALYRAKDAGRNCVMPG
jgi:diguanylate cyclase (GGDEF)-like protein